MRGFTFAMLFVALGAFIACQAVPLEEDEVTGEFRAPAEDEDVDQPNMSAGDIIENPVDNESDPPDSLNNADDVTEPPEDQTVAVPSNDDDVDHEIQLLEEKEKQDILSNKGDDNANVSAHVEPVVDTDPAASDEKSPDSGQAPKSAIGTSGATGAADLPDDSVVDTPEPQINSNSVDETGLPPEYPRRGRDRFRRLAFDCYVRSQPRQDSAQLYSLRPGRVLWVEELNSHWYVVYRKSSVGFMSPRCFGDEKSQVGQVVIQHH